MFKTILVPLDGSPLAEQALGHAIAIARAATAELHLALVHRGFAFDDPSEAAQRSELYNAERDYLDALVADIAATANLPVRHNLLLGDPIDMICSHIADIGADLVVMTTHARTGLNRAWTGSVAHGVVRCSTVPVLALRPLDGSASRDLEPKLFQHILIPLDGSAVSTEVFDAATSLAQCGQARISLRRVVEPIPLLTVEPGLPTAYMAAFGNEPNTERAANEAQEELAATARQLQKESHLVVDANVVVESHVGRAILDLARGSDVDLVAMTTHGRGLSRFLMGSVADKVMRGGSLPMLLYRPRKIAQSTHGADRRESEGAEPPGSTVASTLPTH